MGHDITLTASDNFKLGGYRADPSGKPKAAVVVIQEIFGVNHHIRAVCDRIAAQGYVAIAPSIFDRIEPNFQCGYTPEEVAIARKFVANPDWAAMLRDTQAAIDAVKDVGPVGIVGFCLGGSVAYAAATKLSGPDGGDRLLRRRHRPLRRRQAESADATAFRRKGRRHSLERRRNHQVASGPTSKSTSIPARSTVLIARSARVTTRPSADIARQRASEFFAKHLIVDRHARV